MTRLSTAGGATQKKIVCFLFCVFKVAPLLSLQKSNLSRFFSPQKKIAPHGRFCQAKCSLSVLDCPLPDKHTDQLGVLVRIQKRCYDDVKAELSKQTQQKAHQEKVQKGAIKLRESESRKRLLRTTMGPTPLGTQLGAAGINKNFNSKNFYLCSKKFPLCKSI